jgi:hypothetical protein
MARRSAFICVHLWLLALTGCASPPQAHTTFLRSVDLIDMTDKMAKSFTSDDVIGQRTESDSPWIISISKAANHTNQIIPDREKWLYIGRLRAMLAQSDVAVRRSIIWIIPPERWHIVSEELDVAEEPYGLRMNPTHQLTAEFNALTNTSGRGRSDAYLCEFELIDLHSATIVWEDSWEVKRSVSGRTYD